jgi:hypothetical protein
VQPPDRTVAVDHPVDRVPGPGLFGLDVERDDVRLILRVDEPVEVLPLGEQLVGRVSDQLEAAR